MKGRVNSVRALSRIQGYNESGYTLEVMTEMASTAVTLRESDGWGQTIFSENSLRDSVSRGRLNLSFSRYHRYSLPLYTTSENDHYLVHLQRPQCQPLLTLVSSAKLGKGTLHHQYQNLDFRKAL
jgi:hypothetical protein